MATRSVSTLRGGLLLDREVRELFCIGDTQARWRTLELPSDLPRRGEKKTGRGDIELVLERGVAGL